MQPVAGKGEGEGKGRGRGKGSIPLRKVLACRTKLKHINGLMH